MCYCIFVARKTAKTQNTKGEKKSMAENTKNTKSEVGTIGQMYENRKTKKRGVLESRNEKYKTLCMKGDDGKTFDVVYSTFKSDWRKYQGGVAVNPAKPVEQKSEKPVEQKVEKQKVEKKKEDKPAKEKRPKIDAETRVKTVMSSQKIVDDCIKSSGLNLKSKTLSKGGISVKHNRKTMFEVWPKFGKNKYELAVGEVKLSCDFIKREDNWSLKNLFSTENLAETTSELLEKLKPEIEKREAEIKKSEGEKKEDK